MQKILRTLPQTMLVLSLVPLVARAQQRDAVPRDTTAPASRGLPRDVRREVERTWNAPAALRDTGRTQITEGQIIDGDVAVRNGPLTIAGHVRGRVLAVNSDVTLLPTARIDEDLLVVGGELLGREAAHVGGEIRIYRERLRYETTGERIVAEIDGSGDDESAWRRFERRRSQSWTRLQIASAGAYNRVEGLPVNLGPQLYRPTPWGSVRVDAYGVVRTATSFNSDTSDLGYNVRTEIRVGRGAGIGFGGQLFNTLNSVEPWQLSDLEVGLAAFVFRRDYRDYYAQHGGRIFASLFGQRDVSFTASYGTESWQPRDANKPLTMLRNGLAWRPNPLLDAGRFHVANATFRVDTRNDEDRPWAGWYVVADWERGAGTLSGVAPGSSARPVAPGTHDDYTRGFLDVRRYNRLGPEAQINMRLVLGGWLSGDPLPLERRLSVEGAGTLPGFDFRTPTGGWSTGTCSGPNAPPGIPAECDRIALAQLEYRGDLGLDFLRLRSDDDAPTSGSSRWWRQRVTGTWVLFADAGRGWLVSAPETPISYARNSIPPFGTFRTDVGAGLDFGEIGLYVAKALSAGGTPANLFLRLRHRF